MESQKAISIGVETTTSVREEKKAEWKPYFSERRRVASVTNQDIQLNQKNIACYLGILLV